MGIHSIDVRSGVGIWHWEPDGRVFTAAPALADGRVHVGTSDERVIALDSATGEIQWETDLDAAVWDPVRVVDGIVYVPTGESLIALTTD